MKTPMTQSLSLVLIWSLSLIGMSGCNSEETTANPGHVTSSLQRTCQVPEAQNATDPSYEEVELSNSAVARTWMIPSAQEGIIFVSGVDGGFIEPVDGIYTRMAETNLHNCVSSIFVSYRNPGELATSIEDATTAASYLRDRGISKMAIVGWSFGGAVIAHTATLIPQIMTIIGFSPQSLDTEPFSLLNAQQSLLLFHSTSDENVPFSSSQIIMDEAPSYIHKQLFPIDGADHHLTGTRAKIDPIVNDWINHMLLGVPN